MTFDAMGRLGSMQAGVGGSTVATATYGIAGEVTALSYFGASETRTYNPVLQMTRQTVSGMMDMEYLFTTGANNGRIASSGSCFRRDAELQLRRGEPADAGGDARKRGDQRGWG